MHDQEAQMTPVHARTLLAAVLATLLTASAFAELPAFAQSDGGANWLCRIRFHDEGYGGDTTTTDGVIELDRAAPQADGSIVYMGQGQATATYNAPGCRVTGSPHTHTLMGIVSSEDGRTATVDITPMDMGLYPVVVQCGPQRSEMDVAVNAPEGVELPLQDGASVSYDVRHDLIFAHGGSRGTVSLEYCRPS
jgi:hypothetical protein